MFRDAYHLAGIEIPDFHREDTGGVTVRIFTWTTWQIQAFTGHPVSGAAGRCVAVLLWFIVPNHAAIYCGDGELLHHIPEN